MAGKTRTAKRKTSKKRDGRYRKSKKLGVSSPNPEQGKKKQFSFGFVSGKNGHV